MAIMDTKFKVEKTGGKYHATFTIGDKTFKLAPTSSKIDALILVEQLQMSFNDLYSDWRKDEDRRRYFNEANNAIGLY